MDIVDDIIEMSPESAANAWMDRFIKLYKYGIIDEGVSVKHGKITWTGDSIYDHSIYLDKDRFIIDGNEVFITVELWNKYIKMRELAGALYVRAPKKIAFPDDWSDLSDEQVLENIQYLQKKYKKYKISQPDDKHIKIDNVVICRGQEEIVSGHVVGNGRTYYTINNKTYYRNEENGKELVDLIHLCKMHLVPFKDKVNKWVKDNKSDIKYLGLGGSAVLAIFVFAYFMAIDSDKSAKQSRDQLKKEIVNEVIDSLHKEQQKTLNYNDSIRQNVR